MMNVSVYTKTVQINNSQSNSEFVHIEDSVNLLQIKLRAL
jgi:hypothetical protein